MKTLIRHCFAATSLTTFCLSASAAPVNILESVACSGDAGASEMAPCFVLPGVSSFVFLGEVTRDPNNDIDVSDFLQFSGLLNNLGYSYTFSQAGDSLFGFTYTEDAIAEVFDASNPVGTAFADAGGNLYAAVFLDDTASSGGAYSLSFNAVPAPATAFLAGIGMLIGAASRRKRGEAPSGA